MIFEFISKLFVSTLGLAMLDCVPEIDGPTYSAIVHSAIGGGGWV